MNECRKIEERVRKKEQEIQEFEAQIRDARTYIQALQDVLKILPRDTDEAATPTALRPGSGISKVRDFILSQRRPAHINELLEAVGREPTRENKASLAGSLAAYVRKGEVFTRPAPNTFGLIELGHANEPESPTAGEPPADFGMDEPPPPPPPPPQKPPAFGGRPATPRPVQGGGFPNSTDLDDEIKF
jgi:hypothetical protein